jgi:hypothetical protein
MNIQEAANSIALSKLAAAAGARGVLTPGQYAVDTTVRVTGTVKVGADYDTAPTVSIPLKETLALFIHRCGVTREAAIVALREAMAEAIAVDGKGQGALSETMPIVNETMARVESDIIAHLPRQNRKGAVTTKLNVEELQLV